MSKYIIIDAEAIQQRIEELESKIIPNPNFDSEIDSHNLLFIAKQNELNKILSQSTPLIPEIEKAFDAGRTVNNYKGEWKETYSDDMTSAKYEESKDYISNLKLDI